MEGSRDTKADRLARLQELTAALAGARTTADVARVIVERALPALNGVVGVVAVASEDGRRLRNVAFEGVDDATRDAWQEYPVESPVPVAEAALRRCPIVVSTREERNARYPVLAAVHGLEDGGAVTAFPLFAGDELLGVLGLCFDGDRRFDDDDIAFLRALADQCALAVERARLLERARHEVEVRRRSEEMLRLALSAARMVAWDLDLRTDRVVCSESASAFFGFTDGTREDFYRVIPPEHLPEVLALYERARAGAEVALAAEFRVVAPDGTARWLASRGTIVRDAEGQPARLLGVSVDVTDRKAAELEARESARRKDEFLAVLAHELRNPLAPIRNACALLAGLGPLDPRLERLRDTIDRQSAHMARMVDDLLDLQRLTQGRLTLRAARLDLAALARATVDDLRSGFARAGLTLDLEAPPGPLWVEADPTRITQTLANLLHNSQKFTPRGGAVHVRVGAVDGRARLEVADTGAGIPADRLARLFEPFRPRASDGGGLGLGLLLARGIVEQHRGSLTVTSDGPGRGTRVTVELPGAAAPADRPAPRGVTAAGPRRVLLIEDNADAAEMLRMLLELRGHVVRVAATGEDGVALAEQWVPEVVLSDLGLPGRLDGFGVARALRDRGWRGWLLALSGYGQHQDKERALAAGFDEHLTKPVDPDDLERRLGR